MQLATIGRAQAINATWTGATSSNWNDGTNWNPMNIPGNNDTATFNAASGSANVTVSNGNVRTLAFTNDALANTLTISSSFTIQGSGIENYSAAIQTIINNGNFSVTQSASTGFSIAFTNNHNLYFSSSSTAGAATITNSNGSNLNFSSSSSAGSATIINNSTTTFNGSSSASSATITNYGSLAFYDTTTAGSASITNNGTLAFNNDATTDSATITNGASGTVDFTNSSTNPSLGSLAGGGTVLMPYYGSGTLTVGSLNTSTTFSGVLDDSGGGASLSKVGTGTLRLTGNNNYFGLTTVSAGTLLASGSSGTSLGGSYEVDVASGAKLGGTDLISSANVVILAGGHLAPGDTTPGTLSINNNLYLQNGAILDFRLGTTSDRVNTGLAGGTLSSDGVPGGITINLTNSGGFAANTYILFDFTGGSASIEPTDFTLGTRIAGYDYSFVLDGNTLELVATTAVPEPATYTALLGAGALGLVAVRRRHATGARPT